jgi:Ca2+:H+ antiporter
MLTIFIPLVYLCYLVFQLFSHKDLYADDHSDVQESVPYNAKLTKRLHINQRRNSAASPPRPSNDAIDPGSSQRDLRSVEAGPEEDDAEAPQMGLQTTVALLAVITVVCQWRTLLTVLKVECAE